MNLLVHRVKKLLSNQFFTTLSAKLADIGDYLFIIDLNNRFSAKLMIFVLKFNFRINNKKLKS